MPNEFLTAKEMGERVMSALMAGLHDLRLIKLGDTVRMGNGVLVTFTTPKEGEKYNKAIRRLGGEQCQ